VPDIFSDFFIKAPPEDVYRAVSTPAGLDAWWTKRSSGKAKTGSEFELWFGPEYDWRGVVAACTPGSHFELEIVRADPDWLGTNVGFHLSPSGDGTQVRFQHTGWPTANEHWRISCYCWPMYLRILKRYLEYGEQVDYEKRLEV
jgi:uncharacterized protein YndB with AHSA1/START domain